jgi:hypothetical protein
MSIEGRIKKLEERSVANEPDRAITLVIVTGEIDNKAGEIDWDAIKKHREAADAKVKAAIAEYRAKHPEHTETGIDIICVVDERTKEMTERILKGEGPQRFP